MHDIQHFHMGLYYVVYVAKANDERVLFFQNDSLSTKITTTKNGYNVYERKHQC